MPLQGRSVFRGFCLPWWLQAVQRRELSICCSTVYEHRGKILGIQFNGIHGPLVEICKVFSASLVIQIYPQHVASWVFRYLTGRCWPHFSDGKCADATQLR